MKRKAPLSMMELMVMIAVFALAAALCLQAFVRSDRLSRRAEARDSAAVLCQSVAELVRYGQGNIVDALEKVSGVEAAERNGFFFASYDENWEAVTYGEDRPVDLSYTLRVTEQESGVQGLGKALVEAFAWNNGEMEPLFSIEVSWQKGVTPRG